MSTIAEVPIEKPHIPDDPEAIIESFPHLAVTSTTNTSNGTLPEEPEAIVIESFPEFPPTALTDLNSAVPVGPKAASISTKMFSLTPSTDPPKSSNLEIKDFVRFSEKDADPEGPQITLELTVRPELFLDAPFSVWSTLRYEPPESDVEDRPVTIFWSNSPLLLLHQTPDGFEKVDLESDEGVSTPSPGDEEHVPRDSITEVSSYDPAETMSSLPKSYMKHVQNGETYVLLFPGSSIPWWKFGHLEPEKQLKYGEVKGGERKEIIVPAEHTVEFTVFEREEKEEEFVPTRLGRSNTVPSFRMSFHE